MFRLLCTGAIMAAFMGIWMQAQERRDSGTPSRGKEVFEQCSGCHSAETDERKVGPSLKGLFQRGELRNGQAVTERTSDQKSNEVAMECLLFPISCPIKKRLI
jgi:cytochrome c2